jgi:hypothetical protein
MRHLDRHTLAESDGSAPAILSSSFGAPPSIFDLQGLLCCSFLFLSALVPRLLFCFEVLRQFAKLPLEIQNTSDMGYLTPDSPTYLTLANSLLEGQLAQAISLMRPIGYPAFLALMEARPAMILGAQAVLLSIIPVCTFILVRLLTRNVWIATSAGLVAIVSPTGIALGSLIMSDGPFASLFAILLVALVHGAWSNSRRWIAVSAFVSGTAVLIRPILLLWPICSVVIYVLIISSPWNSPLRSYFGRKELLNMLTLFSVPMTFMVCWAALNYLQNGVFTVSEAGVYDLRLYLAVKTEQWEKAGGQPSDLAIKNNQTDLRNRLEALPNEERVHAYLVEGWAVLRQYPITATKVFVHDALKDSSGGWNYFARQLPLSQDKYGSFFSRLSKLESWCRKATLFVLSLAAAFILIASRDRLSLCDGKFLGTFVSMVLTTYYFVLISGILFWTGPRVIYPTEIAQITAVMLLAHLVGRANGA